VTLPKGRQKVLVRAFAPDGETQPFEPRWQPSGYMHNVVEALTLEAL
jgi:hypothetical protein